MADSRPLAFDSVIYRVPALANVTSTSSINAQARVRACHGAAFTVRTLPSCSKRTRRMVDHELLAEMVDIQTSSQWKPTGTVGPRDAAPERDFVRPQGVERLMRNTGLQGIPAQELAAGCDPAGSGCDRGVGPVNRNLTAGEPDRLRLADALRIACGEDVFWLAAVRDASSNRIVGWRRSHCCHTDLVLAVLEYAIWAGDVQDRQLPRQVDVLRPTQRFCSRIVWRTTGSRKVSYYHQVPAGTR